MQRLIFILICTLLLIKPTANAIFLSSLGVERLPFAYLAVAVTAFFVTLLYNRYVDRVPSRSLFKKALIISAVLLILIGTLLFLSISKPVVAFFFYIFISIYGILSASLFWISINQVFDAREARKYFGVIGAGAIAGGIAGGYLATLISTITHSEVIPFVAAFLIIIATIMIRKIPTPASNNPVQIKTDSKHDKLLSPLILIKKMRHLSFLALILAVSVFVAKLIDYQFGYFATQNYTQEEDLTAFYGFWFSTFNIISLLIQILLTTRIVGRFGVGYSLLILPVLLLLNSLLLLLIPVLVLAITLKLTDACMKQSINKAAIELMMLPIPEDIKLRTKTVLDVFIDSLATGFSGIILIFVVKALDLPNAIINAVIVAGTLCWLFLANSLRKEYKSVFRQSLKIQSAKVAPSPGTIIQDFDHVLTQGNDYQILKSLSFLKDLPVYGLEDTIRKLLNHQSDRIVEATIEMILFDKADFADEIKPLLLHPNQNVRIAAFEYLINHQNTLEPDFLINLLNDDKPEIRIVALTAYAKQFQQNINTLEVLRIKDRLRKIIHDTTDTGSQNDYVIIGILKTISYGRYTEFYDFIQNRLKIKDKVVYPHAIRAAGETRSSKFFTLLFERLDDPDVPDTIYTALSKYGMKRIRKFVDRLLAENKTNLLSRTCRVIELIPNQLSVSTLQLLSEHEDLSVRNNAIRSLGQLREKYPLLRIDEPIIHQLLLEEASYSNKVLNILLKHEEEAMYKNDEAFKALIEVLKQKVDHNLSIIFELLNIKYPPEKYLEIYDYVKGPDHILRNNAIEYLDNALGSDLKSAVMRLVQYNAKTVFPEIQPKEKMDERSIKAFLINNRDEEISRLAKDYFRV